MDYPQPELTVRMPTHNTFLSGQPTVPLDLEQSECRGQKPAAPFSLPSGPLPCQRPEGGGVSPCRAA